MLMLNTQYFIPITHLKVLVITKSTFLLVCDISGLPLMINITKSLCGFK